MKSPRHTIKLFVQNGHWVARHSNPEVIKAFGASDIPTVYLESNQASVVLAQITLKNLECDVSLLDEGMRVVTVNERLLANFKLIIEGIANGAQIPPDGAAVAVWRELIAEIEASTSANFPPMVVEELAAKGVQRLGMSQRRCQQSYDEARAVIEKCAKELTLVNAAMVIATKEAR